jgi:beta-lactamase regulating signal transducer with metallopeptidase domain
MIATLARASVEGALLVVMVWLLARLFRLSPAIRTVLWWCAAAKFVVAFAWMAPIEIPVLPSQSPAIVATVHGVTAPAISDENADAKASRREPPAAARLSLAGIGDGLREWSSVVAIAWTLGLTAVVLIGLRRWHATARILRESTPAPNVVQADAVELATLLGLRRVPEIRVSAPAETPLVTGLLRPVVVLPGRLNTLSDEQRRMVICHELAHLKRADLWLGCVPALAERMFFFHPLAHVASREYALAREAACDASVMRTLDAAPQDYGRLLLALGISPSGRGLTAAGAAWSFQNLKRRISMLQDISVRSKRSDLLTAVTVGLAVVALAPLRLVARPSPSQTTASRAPSVSVDERRELANAQTQNDRQAAKSERRRPESGGVRFVLLSEDGSRTTSAEERGDVERAERQRRNGQALLWFRKDGREYVIRDPEVLREVRALWTNVYHHHPPFDADAVRELTQSLESLKLDDLVEQSALMAQSVTDMAIGDHAQLITEQATHAAEAGLLVAQEALDQHLHSIDTPALEEHIRALEKSTDHLDHQIEHSMRELEHHLKGDIDERMKDLDQRLRDLDFSHLSEFGRSTSDAAKQATDEMRTLIDRAIRNGQATLVR